MANFEDNGSNGIDVSNKGYYQKRREVHDVVDYSRSEKGLADIGSIVQQMDKAFENIKKNANGISVGRLSNELRAVKKEYSALMKDFGNGKLVFSNTKEIENFYNKVIDCYDNIVVKAEEVSGSDLGMDSRAKEVDDLIKKVEILSDNLDLLKKKSPAKKLGEDFKDLVKTITGVELVKNAGQLIKNIQGQLTGGDNSSADVLYKFAKNAGISWDTANDYSKKMYKVNQQVNKQIGHQTLAMKDVNNYLQTVVNIGWKNYHLAEDSYKDIALGIQTLALNTDQIDKITDLESFLGKTDIVSSITDAINEADMTIGNYGVNKFSKDTVTDSIANIVDNINVKAGARVTSGQSLEEAQAWAEAATESATAASILMEAATGSSDVWKEWMTGWDLGTWNDTVDKLASVGFVAGDARYYNDLAAQGDYLTIGKDLLKSFENYQKSVGKAGADWDSGTWFRNYLTQTGVYSSGEITDLESSTLGQLFKGYLKQSAVNQGKDVESIEQAVQEILKNRGGATERAKSEEKKPWDQQILEWLQNTFGGLFGSGGFFALGQIAFAAYIASGVFKVGKDLYSFFRGGSNVGGLFSKFLGKGSALATSSGEMAGQMSLFNTGSSAAGSSVLGTAATVAGGVALGLGAAAVIAKGIEAAQSKTEQNELSAAKSQLEGTKLAGNAAAETTKAIGSTYSDKNNNFMKEFGSGFTTTMRGIGVGLLGWTRDLKAINQDDWAFFKDKMNMMHMDEKQIEAYMTAWGLLLMSAGRKSDVDFFKDWTSEDVKQLMEEKGWSKEYLNRIVNHNSFGFHPNKSTSEDQKSIDWDKLGIGGQYLPNSAAYGIGGGGADYNHKPPITAGWPTYPSGGRHKGIDFGVSRGTPIGSSGSGVVEAVGTGITREGWLGNNADHRGWGNYVQVRGDDGRRYTYAHLREVNISKGTKVNAGTLLGKSGNTGNTTGPHLHYQVDAKDGTNLDPFDFLSDSIFNVGDSSNSVTGRATSNVVDESGNPIADDRAAVSYIGTRSSDLQNKLSSYYSDFGFGGNDTGVVKSDNSDVVESLNANFGDMKTFLGELIAVKNQNEEILRQLQVLHGDSDNNPLYSY